MKKPLPRLLFSLVLILTAATVQAQTGPAAPYDLRECYQLALRTSERLQRSEQDIRIAEAQYRQTLAAIYPDLSLGLAQYSRDNVNFGRVVRGSTTTEDGATPSAGQTGSIGKTQSDAILSVTQPLFTGFREFILAEALEQEQSALRFDVARNRELLFQDVAELFYQALDAEAELLVLARSLKTLDERIRNLNEFRQLGKSRESEVLAAKSDLEDLQVLRESTAGTLQASKELLAFLTGVPAAELPLQTELPQGDIGAVDSYLAKVNQRADVRAAELRVIAQQRRVTVAERGLWPRIDLQGNAYAFEDPDRSRDWDAKVLLSLPLFDGGRTEAQTDEEQARLRSVDLVTQETKRIVERDIRAAYVRTASVERELVQLRELLAAARKNYQSQRKDYELGVVTNLEVLQAIRLQQEAERRIVAAEHRRASLLAALEVAAGGVAQ